MTCSVQRSWILQNVLFSQHLRFLEEKTSWARSSLLGTSTFMQRTVVIMLSSLSFYDHCLNRLLRTKHCSVCYSSLLSLHSHSTMKLETVPRRHYIQHNTTHTKYTHTHKMSTSETLKISRLEIVVSCIDMDIVTFSTSFHLSSGTEAFKSNIQPTFITTYLV